MYEMDAPPAITAKAVHRQGVYAISCVSVSLDKREGNGDVHMFEFNAPTTITTKAVLRQGIASSSASTLNCQRSLSPQIPMVMTLPWSKSRSCHPYNILERLRERGFCSRAARPAKEYGRLRSLAVHAALRRACQCPLIP